MKLTYIIGSSIYLVLTVVLSLWAAGVVLMTKTFGVEMASTVSPMTWVQYLIHYRSNVVYGEHVMSSGYMGFLVFMGLLLMGGYFLQRIGNPNKQKQHGDARFASKKEIIKTGLLTGNGIIVGKYKGRKLKFGGNEFVLLAAPTRGGKGVSVVIPNALEFPESLVVMDVKGENQEITSKYRASQGHNVFCFNPFNEEGKTHRYNPLSYVRDDKRFRVGDINKIGATLYPLDGEHSFFQNQARSLFTGLALYLLETPSLPMTIGEIYRQASGKGLEPADYFRSLIEDRDKTSNPLSEECKDAFNRYLGTNEDLKGSIIAAFNAPLNLFSDPTFDAATSESDFNFLDLRKIKMTVYFGIPVSRMDESKLLVNLFWNQLIAENTKELPSKNPDLKYKVVLLMDEMPMMGRVGMIAKGSAFIAGYNLRLVTIVQSPQQLYANPPEGYGQQTARALISNHSCKMIFTPDELADAEEMSKLLGTYTYKSKSVSYGNKKKSTLDLTASGSISEQRRELMLPQELREMPFENHILLMKGHKPIIAEKVMYFKDPGYVGMLKSVSPSLQSLGNKIPSQDEFENAWANEELMIDLPQLNMTRFEAKTIGATRSASVEEIEKADRDDIAANTASVIDDAKTELSKTEAETMAKDWANVTSEDRAVFFAEHSSKSDPASKPVVSAKTTTIEQTAGA